MQTENRKIQPCLQFYVKILNILFVKFNYLTEMKRGAKVFNDRGSNFLMNCDSKQNSVNRNE